MPTGAQNLGSQLGSLLFGKPDASDKSYLEGQLAGATVDDRMASARKARAEALIGEDRLKARQGVNPDAITTAGYAPNQAALLGSILRSNDNVDLRDLGALQAPTAGQAMVDARDAMKGGNSGLGNLMLALADGKPLETTTITDGTAYNKYGASDQPMTTTALGDASIGLKHAQAGASNASAASSYASAENSHASAAEHRERTGQIHLGLDGKRTMPPISDVTASLPKHPVPGNVFAQPTTDPADVAKVLSWLAHNKGANIGDYVSQSPVGSPGSLPPAGSEPLGLGEMTPAPTAGAPVQPAAAPSKPAPDPAAPAKPASKSDFDALPSGAMFINPADGRLMRKK